jgi:ureidoacrylate peracid hydrolase
MHQYSMSESIKERVLRRQGKLVSHETIEARKCALIVVDMQNYFVSEDVPGSVPLARSVVPNINRMARALRAAGGAVVWVQTTATGALEYWANHHKYQLTAERKARRLSSLDESADAYKLYGKLEALPTDLRVKKIKYSAFIQNSSKLSEELQQRGIESVIITGTATNVCCESTARDAMLLDYRVIMLADGNAAWTDEEHAATLDNCALFFGDVMTTNEAVARLVPVAQRKTA